MALVDRIFAMTVMALILVFSLIHLGVSIGIIVPYRKYGDIFRPQIGLSGFNIVISLFGFLTGILGIVAISLRSEGFARIVCLISGLLGIFALASLISALIINSKSSNYVSSHFSSNLIAYKNDANARSRIDLLQNKYQCCGTDMWLDWTRGQLNTTSSMTNVTGASNITTGTTLSTMTTTTSTLPAGSPTTSQATSGTVGKRDINHISNDLHRRQVLQSTDYSRKKRQATSSYGGIEGLPITFDVVLPASCCTSGATLTSNSSDAYCISNYNGAVNHFYTAGCAKLIDITASNQAMGFGVINSFMVVLAFVAIPVLLGNPSDSV